MVTAEYMKEYRSRPGKAEQHVKNNMRYQQSEKGKDVKNALNRAYYQTKAGLETRKRGDSKRRRGLSYIKLNESFPGSVGHHVDRERVLFIPEKLHRSISHNLTTGKGMMEINRRALEWRDKQWERT